MAMMIKRILALLLCCSILFVTAPAGFAQSEQPAKLTSKELEQFVAPIALYPDALVAQILAASTYPIQVVEADRWMQQHSKLKGKKLADEVNKQSWDPSVKALTQFPSVLANMDDNLSWTSSLGDAYMNQPDDVMNTIQVLRRRAKQAGNLNTTSEEEVTENGKDIIIEPADPSVVYVPEYDPWICYGAPIGIWPDWYWYPGLFFPGPGIAFGFGFGIGFFGGFAWGWPHWGFNWGHRAIIYNHMAFASHSRTFVNRNSFYHGHPAFNARGFGGSGRRFGGAGRGFTAPRSQRGMRSSAFSGFNRGGIPRSYLFRGRSSFGGGFHSRGFGGGFHGGGGRR
jgi:hypothetical protein